MYVSLSFFLSFSLFVSVTSTGHSLTLSQCDEHRLFPLPLPLSVLASSFNLSRSDVFPLSRGLINSGLVGSGSGSARAEDAQGTPTQSHISPSILVYEH